MTMPQDRYSRQMLFKGIGPAGQERLGNAHVVIIGCGALGSGIAHVLGRAGVGHIRIVDRDLLGITNLHRQVLFEEEDVRLNLPKAVAAANRLRAINSDIEVEPIVTDVTSENILELIAGADVVADGSDNMTLRFLLNDACVKAGVPWVYGGAVASSGMSLTVIPGHTACLRCILEDKPGAGALATCDTVGVLGTLTAVVSAVEAGEVIKLLVDPEQINRDLLRFNVWSLDFRKTPVSRRAGCPACGLRRFDHLNAPPVHSGERLGARAAVQVTPRRPRKLDLDALAESLRDAGSVEYNPYVLKLVLPEAELAIFPDGRTIVTGISDESAACALVERFLGPLS